MVKNWQMGQAEDERRMCRTSTARQSRRETTALSEIYRTITGDACRASAAQ